jgi:hypothetical protein
MALSKLQMQLFAIAVGLGSLGLAFWQCAGLVWDAGGVAGVITAWVLGPISMTVAAWHAGLQAGNWWPMISLFVGMPLALVMYFSADSLEGSGF